MNAFVVDASSRESRGSGNQSAGRSSRTIAAGAPLSVKATLASAHQYVDPVEAEARSKLGALYSTLYRTEDFIEGRRAKAEGRPPRYQGK